MRFHARVALSTSVCLAALGLFGVAMPALAQEPTRERVQTALDQTDRRIEQAQTLVSGADNDQAEIELTTASDMQTRARGAFTANQLRLSLGLTLDARAHADRAIALVRGLPDPDRVRVQLERTRELIDRARDRIEECRNERARALLRVAVEMQARAESAVGDGRYLAALQLTLSARDRVLRALRLCNIADNVQEASERALRRTQELIGRARDVVAENDREPARVALARAVELQSQAEVQFRLDHFEASLRLTQSARAFAHRAMRLSQGRP
jgi:hypothetical protein